MFRKAVFSVVILLALTQCSNHANQFLLEDFDVHDSEITISLLTLELDALYEQFPDHEFGALRPAERTIFDRQLLDLFNSQTTSEVKGKLDQTVLHDIEFEKGSFGVRNSELNILSPAKGTRIKNGTIDSRFVLILDQFHFTPYQVQSGGSQYAGHEGEIENRLRLEMKYLIWDNNAGEAIAWGRINNSERLSMQDQNSTYRSLLSEAFSRIVRVSPFSPVEASV